MTVFISETHVAWGELDIPLLGLDKDWHGTPLALPAGYSLVMDPTRLWFIASHRESAELHPKARPGLFQPDLWEHDVAELFIGHANSGRYLEFNLAPNGAWWSCEFTGLRQRAEEVDVAMPDVATFAEMAPDGSWLAAMALPLDLLKARIGFGSGSVANVAMILHSPRQRFLSAAALPGSQPDFHQPAAFPKLNFVPLQHVPK